MGPLAQPAGLLCRCKRKNNYISLYYTKDKITEFVLLSSACRLFRYLIITYLIIITTLQNRHNNKAANIILTDN